MTCISKKPPTTCKWFFFALPAGLEPAILQRKKNPAFVFDPALCWRSRNVPLPYKRKQSALRISE
jgi:hypothetical protein